MLAPIRQRASTQNAFDQPRVGLYGKPPVVGERFHRFDSSPKGTGDHSVNLKPTQELSELHGLSIAVRRERSARMLAGCRSVTNQHDLAHRVCIAMWIELPDHRGDVTTRRARPRPSLTSSAGTSAPSATFGKLGFGEAWAELHSCTVDLLDDVFHRHSGCETSVTRSAARA